MYSPLSQTSMDGVSRMIANRIDLPVLPSIASIVMTELTGPKSSADRVAQILRNDSAIASRILRIANSTIYKRHLPTTTLEAAIVRLGRNLVRDLTISLSTKYLFKSTDASDQHLWNHSVASAIGGKIVAETTRHGDPNEAFVTGLLHDIGKVVLKNDNPDRFNGTVQRASKEDMLSFHAEERAFSFHHAAVGGTLLKQWKFPQKLIEAVYWHHDIDAFDQIPTGSRKLACITAYSDYLANSIGINIGMKELTAIPPGIAAQQYLGISERKNRKLQKKIETIYQQEAELFN